MKLISLSVIALVVMFATAFGPSQGATGKSEAPACAAAASEDIAIGPVTCGGVVCGKNQHCCNASCGKCAPAGVECPQIACEGGADAAASEQAF